MANVEPLHEQYRQLSIQSALALSIVAVTAKALAAGDTDAELQAAETLEQATSILKEISAESSSMWHQVRELENR